ncbi:MAG: response regulator [Deltaproteobacteria bacterium]|nr:response regulator [Deltaproteobacteria bacterium]
MTGKSILLVDADAKSQRVVEVALRKAGFEVTSKSSAESALSAFPVCSPGLVFIESRLPDGSGLELLSKLRAIDPTLASIIVSSDRSKDARVRAVQAGASDFLTKPLFAREVVARALAAFEHKEGEAVSRRDGPDAVEGALAALGLVDALQIIETGQKTGMLEVRSSPNESHGLVGETEAPGRLWFQNGWMLEAEIGALRGEEALYRMLCFDEGSYVFTVGPVEREGAPVPIASLLIEGLARVDEWAKLWPRLPALDRQLRVDYRKLASVMESLPAEVHELLPLFDGRRSIRESLDHSPLRDLEHLTIVAKLLDDGVLSEGSADRQPASSLDQWLSQAPEGPVPARSHEPSPRSPSALLPRSRPATALPEPLPTEPPGPRVSPETTSTVALRREVPISPPLHPSPRAAQAARALQAPLDDQAVTLAGLPRIDSARLPNLRVPEETSELWELDALPLSTREPLRRSPLAETTAIEPPSARLPPETTAVPKTARELPHRAVPAKRASEPVVPLRSEAPPPRKGESPPPRRSEPAPAPASKGKSEPPPPRDAPIAPQPLPPLPRPQISPVDHFEEFHAAESRRKLRVLVGMIGGLVGLVLLLVWFFFLQPKQEHIPMPLPPPRPIPREEKRPAAAWPASPDEQIATGTSAEPTTGQPASAALADAEAKAREDEARRDAEAKAREDVARRDAEAKAREDKARAEAKAKEDATARAAAAAKAKEEARARAAAEAAARAEPSRPERAAVKSEPQKVAAPTKSPETTAEGLPIAGVGKALQKAEKAIAAEDYASARTELNAVIRTDPRNAHAHAGLAFVHYASGELTAARRVAKWALELDSKNARALLTLGSAALEENDSKAALEAFKRFLVAAPRHPRASEIRNLVTQLEKKR